MRGCLQAILSSVLLGASYLPNYPWAIFFCLVPLWLAIEKTKSLRQILFLAWLFQFGFNLISAHWIVHTASEFFDFGYIQSFLTLIAYSSFGSWHIVLATAVWWFFAKRVQNFNLKLLVLSALLVLAEITLPRLFPWILGVAWLRAGWSGFQFADVMGFYGLSFLTLLFNIYFLNLWHKRGSTQSLFLKLTLFLFAFWLFNKLGESHAQKWKHWDSQINILAVQGVVSNDVRSDSEKGQLLAKKEVSDHYRDLTLSSFNDSKEVDLIVWPESAHPEFLNPQYKDRYFYRRLAKLTQYLNTPLITGAPSVINTNNKSKLERANGMFFFKKTGLATSFYYEKNTLMPFGEYVPGSNLFPALKNLLPSFSEFRARVSPPIHTFAGLELGLQICYEGLFPNHTRKSVVKRANFLINLSNDSWFGSSYEPTQHLYLTLARAIEFRRPLLRVASNGITAGIQTDGTTLKSIPYDTDGSQAYLFTFQKKPANTLFFLYGKWLPLFFVMVSVVAAICGIRERSLFLTANKKRIDPF